MKTLELECYEVSQLSSDELKSVDGGYWWVVVGGAILVYDAATDFLKGFQDGYNSRQK